MNLSETVVESDSDFIDRIDFLFDPDLHVIEEHAHLLWDPPVIDPDISLASAISSGPPPDVAEHLAMEVLDKCLREDEPAPPQRPLLTTRNIFLLGGIEVVPICNMSRLEIAFLVFCERGCPSYLVRQKCHSCLFPNRAGLEFAREGIKASFKICGREVLLLEQH